MALQGSRALGVWMSNAPMQAGDFILESAATGIVATAGGGQSGATVLNAQTNRITTVATRGDSVMLPPSTVGMDIVVINRGANPLAVFPQVGDQINGLAVNTSILMPANSVDMFCCGVAGQWEAEAGVGFSGSLPTVLSQDSLVAFAGGGQASATQITSDVNRVITVATAGDSVKLPASAAGLDVYVVNHGANPMQVFGVGTDTIDDVAAATGVSQMPGSVCIYSCTTAGAWYSNGIGTGFMGSFPTVSSTDGITAFATGGQTNAVLLTTAINRVTVVGTAGDSVKLPVTTAVLPANGAGLQVTVANAGANSLNVFPNTGEIINALAANTAFAVAAGKTATFTATKPGQWHTILSA